MVRHIALLTLGLAAVGGLNAGYIQIGGNTGLTSTYTANGLSITTTGNMGERSYNAADFNGLGTNNSAVSGGNSNTSLCIGATTATCVAPASTTVITGDPANEFASGNGVTFALVNQTINGAPMGVWAPTAANTTTASVTIPMGIFSVTNVYTMLNDVFGLTATGSNTPTSVKFDFGSSATVASSSETFTLVNGTVIRSDFSCTTTSLCTSVATSLDTVNLYDINGVSGAATGAAHVSAFNVWQGSYANAPGGAYIGTSGNLNLDAQNFFLGSAATGKYLVDMVLTDTVTNGSSTYSRDALAAVTVFSSATPEPSTILLFATGLGALGIMRKRRKQK